MTWQDLHTWFWGFSAILLCRSSQALSGWMGTSVDSPFQVSSEMFDWVQVRALAGPLIDIHRVVPKLLLCCLGCVLHVLLEGKPSAQHKVLSALDQVFYEGYLCTLLRSAFPEPWPVPQSLPLKNTVGTVLGRKWAVPGFLQTWRLELRTNSSVLFSSDLKILFLPVRESFRCFFICKLQAGFHVPFTEKRFPSGHSAITPRSVKCCSDAYPSGKFLLSLYTGSLELSHSDHQVLGHLSYQGPSPPHHAQFGWAASSRKSPGCSKLLPFKNYGGHCALGNIQYSRNIFVAFPRSVPRHSPVSESLQAVPSNFMAWFLLLYALSAVRPNIDRFVTFQIMSNQLNLPQVDSNHGVENISKMIKRNGRHPS